MTTIIKYLDTMARIDLHTPPPWRLLKALRGPRDVCLVVGGIDTSRGRQKGTQGPTRATYSVSDWMIVPNMAPEESQEVHADTNRGWLEKVGGIMERRGLDFIAVAHTHYNIPSSLPTYVDTIYHPPDVPLGIILKPTNHAEHGGRNMIHVYERSDPF